MRVGAKVTASATPKSDTKRPHIFKVRGGITPTARPVKCAAGVTNLRYCTPGTIDDVCKGKVRITIKRGVRAIARTTVKLTIKCRYAATIKMTKRQKHGRLSIVARFLGNGLVNPRNSPKLKIKV